MMNITCWTSAVSLRCRCDAPSYCLDDARFESNPLLIPSSLTPSGCCSCCCCCAHETSIYHGLPKINPNFLRNGLRQSALIQWPSCKRLVFHGRRRPSRNNSVSGFASISDFDRDYYYEKLKSFRGYGIRGFEDKRGKEGFGNGDAHDCGDDVEMMLSLLTEEVDLDYLGVRSQKRVEKKGLGNVGGGGGAARVRSTAEDGRRRREEERGGLMRGAGTQGSGGSSYHSVSSGGELESGGGGGGVIKARCDGEAALRVRSRAADGRLRRRNERREEETGGLTRGVGTQGSGGSLYHSVSSGGDFEGNGGSGGGVEAKRHGDELSSDEKVEEDVGEISKKTTSVEGYRGESIGVHQDWRKESEKKLESHVSSSYDRNSQQRSQKIDRIIDQSESRTKYKRFTDVSERDKIVTESKKQASFQETQSNVISDVSENQEIDTRKASSSAVSEILTKNREDVSIEIKRQVEDSRVEKHQETSDSTERNHSGVKSQQVSDTRVTDTQSVLVSRRESDARTEKEERFSESSSSQVEVTEDRLVDHWRMSVEDSQTESRKTGRRTTTKALSFHVGMPREPPAAYKALKLNPEPSAAEGGAAGGGGGSSRPVVTSPPKLIHEPSPERFQTATGELKEPLRLVGREDTLLSADRQQKSAADVVGGFVGKAKDKLSGANEKKPEGAKSSGQDGLGSSRRTGDGSRRLSRGSGLKGPSDEMWHVTDASIPEQLETVAPDHASSSSGNGNGNDDEGTKRTRGSWWNVVGDVLRFRWASPRSETHTPKSGAGGGGGGIGGKGFSNQSSEAWFSGNEPEEPHKDESNPSSSGQTAQNEGFESPFSSSNTNKESVVEEPSFPSPAIRMRRSPMVKKSSETGGTDAASGGKTAEPLADPDDGELTKRRKLGRADQVSRDRFDEWAEAYTVETEQRKTDERFMREALSEARKAADVWEVPVGAVLVHDGRIIARGYNLVEKLRDATAHAEMICIREASNHLRSWRLSDTTLYVTLEPCPMCAGAIFQARIDTVVWGAPNKLLGADGSWIRLFPDGEGGNASEMTDKPPAPVHPFHPNVTVRRGVLSSECADTMQQFFQLRRKKKDKKAEAEPPPPPPLPPSLPISHHHHRSKLFSKLQDAFSIMFCL